MEDLATKNVEKVTKVADDVTQHNKTYWRNAIATWTMIFVILGTFLFCFMTIRMVPRRPNKCLFFCGKPECSTMADGSIVCVDTKGKLYVKKQAPIAVVQEEEITSHHVQECEVGLNGECVETATIAAAPQVGDEHESTVDGTDEPVCHEDGECKARYDDEVSHAAECTSDECLASDLGQTKVDEQKSEESQAQKHDPSDGEISSERDEVEVGHSHTEEEQVTEKDADEPHEAVKRHEVEEADREEEKRDDVGTEPLNFTVEDVRTAAKMGDAILLERYLRPKPHYGRFPDENGWQPIHEAARAAHVDCVKVLLNVGDVDVNARTGKLSDGYTALWLAKNLGLDDSHDLVRFLKSHGAVSLGPGEVPPEERRNNQSELIENPLSTNRIKRTSDPTHLELESERLDFSANDVRLAAAAGDVALLKRYLYLMPEYGSVPDENGWQAIHEATKAAELECVEVLLREGKVDANARTGLVSDGVTPLWMAYNKLGLDDSHELVRLLKSHGAVSIGQSEALPFIPKDDFSQEQLGMFTLEDLHKAAAAGDDIRVAQYIVTKPELVEAPDENGWRALHEAVRMGRRISTQLLINSGSNLNAPTGDGWSPLALAIYLHGEDHPVTRVLRKYGAEAVYGKLQE